jgi:hypothetical protein
MKYSSVRMSGGKILSGAPAPLPAEAPVPVGEGAEVDPWYLSKAKAGSRRSQQAVSCQLFANPLAELRTNFHIEAVRFVVSVCFPGPFIWARGCFRLKVKMTLCAMLRTGFLF